MQRFGNRQATCVTVALALAACRATVPVRSSDTPLSRSCAVDLAPHPIAGDSAVVFLEGVTVVDTCVLQRAAGSLSPWPNATRDRWIVGIEVAAPGTVVIRRLTPGAARDLIDGDAFTAIVTEDRSVAAYASARPDLAVELLPWTRTYALVSRDTLSLGMAMDGTVVHVDARTASGLPACDLSPPSPSPSPRTNRVVYLDGDRTAQEIAERLVAFADAPAIPLSYHELDAALIAGRERAYVVSFATGDWCAERTGLTTRAPWLQQGVVVPLLETRAFAIRRRP
jgi:hypothetical protein